jgi:uncharacterized membrane-anchored protein YjiN (DUF445 family)
VMSPRPVKGVAAAARDEQRRRDLRRMKTVATGLLVAMTVVFVAASALEDRYGGFAYVRATAEAAMVGALADWFAVTALFRHPLGLPIPHTAIVQERKDQIGRSLGDFVEHEFLDGTLLVERVRAAALPARVGAWLSEPSNVSRLSSNAGDVVRAVLEVLNDDDVQAGLELAVVTKVRTVPAAPIAGKALEVAIEGGHHEALVDSVLAATADFLVEHRGVLRERVAVESPWWVPEPIDDRIFDKAFGGLQRFLTDLSHDPTHPLRASFDARLTELAVRLRTSPELATRGEELKEELLAHPSVRAWSSSLWSELKAELVAASHDPSSPLRQRLDEALLGFGERLQADPALQDKVERWLEEAVGYLAAQHRGEVASFIAATVGRWDAEETSRKLELQVGRDLQFIRINGTVVGGLAGLVIFTVGRALF